MICNVKLAERRLGAFASIVTFLFWQLVIQLTDKSPSYGGELFAAKSVTWRSFWTWTDYDGYDRFSPFGALLIAVFDTRIIRPIVSPETIGDDLTTANFLVQPLVFLFVIVTYLLFRLLKYLGAADIAAFVGALFVGTHKGFDYYFGFVAATSIILLLIATVLNFYSYIRYLDTFKKRHLIVFLITMFWCVGLWEQWIALPLVLIIFSLASYMSTRLRGDWDRSILLRWGILFPLTVLGAYLIFRSSRMAETNQVSEAEWIFTYPSVWLMLEEIVVNATHRIGSTFESLFFPHPMLSAAIIGNYTPDEINQYNSAYTVASSFHYYTLADWYVGWISGIVLTVFGFWCRWVYKNANQQELRATLIGFAFLFLGFIQHLPIKYRTYFTLPGYASLLDYKQALSFIGAAILISTMLTVWIERSKKEKRKVTILIFVLTIWLIFNNLSKVMINAWIM